MTQMLTMAIKTETAKTLNTTNHNDDDADDDDNVDDRYFGPLHSTAWKKVKFSSLKEKGLLWLRVGRLTFQQHASVSQGRIF